MSEFNSFTAIARMAGDPQEKQTKNGKVYASFRVAYSRGFGDFKKSNFVGVNVYGKDAEYVLKFGAKGRRILLSGELAVEQSESKQNPGTQMTWVTVHANMGGVSFLDAPDERATVANARQTTAPAQDIQESIPEFAGLIPIDDEPF